MAKFTQKRLRGVLIDALGGLLIACGLVIFAKDAGFAPGGIQGLALIIYHFTNLPLGTLSLLLNIPLFIISYRTLGRSFILRTLQTVVISSVFTDVLGPYMPSYQGDPLLAAAFSAALIGLGLAIVYQTGSSTGGTDLVIFSLRKRRPDLSLGQVTNLINALIISLGGIVFKNIDAVLYGFIFTIVLATVVDKVMYGFSSGKMAFIISDRAEELASVVGEKVKRGSTIIPALGGYTKQPRPMLMVVCNRRQLQLLREVVQNEDPEAMLIVSEFNAVYGHGFLPLLQQHLDEADLSHLEGREGGLDKIG